MSADNWTHCPKCRAAAEAKVEALEAATRKAYGKVPSDEYEDLRERDTKASAALDKAEPTLREDYEIGITEGEFSVHFRASCRCGFSYELKHGPVEVTK